MLRAIAGAHRPHGGRVLIDGADITSMPAHRRGSHGCPGGARPEPRARGRGPRHLLARRPRRARRTGRLAGPRPRGQRVLRPQAPRMTILNAILQGIFLGAFYAVLACGLSIMFGVMRIINLAHGDVAVLGAYIVFVIVDRTGVSAFVAFLIALPVMVVLGYALHFSVLERSLRAGILTPLLATFGLSIVIQNL